jgi:mRNA-degrading endonuclease RelE of RelBE toxin-antitoxin system
VIEELPRDVFAGDTQKMRGEEQTWRRRVGAYRILYELEKNPDVVVVFHVERRTSKTYRQR